MSGVVTRLREDERLLILCGSTMLVMMGQGVVSPLLPLYAREFGVSTVMVGLTFTTFAAARLVLNIPAGLMADRRGRRCLLVGGPAISAIGMLGSGLSLGIWDLLAWRFVAGAGSALYMTGAQIYIVDIAAPDERARFIATNQGALLVGISLGPGLGGLTAELWGLRAPFFFVAAASVLTAIYGYSRLPETNGLVAEATKNQSQAETDMTLRDLLLNPRFIALGWVTLSIFSIRSGARGTLIPLLGDAELDIGPGELGLIFTLTGVLGLALIGPAAWIADKYGRRVAIIPTSIVAGIGLLIVASGDALWLFVLGNFVLAAGTGVSGPAPAAYVADLAPAHLRGMAFAVYRSVGDVGLLLAPPILGVLVDATSLRTGIAVNATVLFFAALWFAVATIGDNGRRIDEAAP